MFERDFGGDRRDGPGSAEHEQFDLESLIKAAGDYVQPGGEVRPQVIEAVRQQSARRNSRRPLLRWTGLGLAAVVAVAAIGHSMSSWSPPGVTANEMFERAQHRSDATRVPLDWALSEVVQEWRHSAESAGPVLKVGER